MTGNSQMFTNYADNPVWQELMKVTGVKLEFVHPTYGAAKEGFGLMIGCRCYFITAVWQKKWISEKRIVSCQGKADSV